MTLPKFPHNKVRRTTPFSLSVFVSILQNIVQLTFMTLSLAVTNIKSVTHPLTPLF